MTSRKEKLYAEVAKLEEKSAKLEKALHAARFVLDRDVEFVDAVNNVCFLAQDILNKGTMRCVVADLFLTADDKIVWTLSSGESDFSGVITENGVVSANPYYSEYTLIWTYVMESLDGESEWNDHYYCDPLPYDSGELNFSVNLILDAF